MDRDRDRRAASMDHQELLEDGEISGDHVHTSATVHEDTDEQDEEETLTSQSPRPRSDFPPEDQYGTGRGQSYRPGGARERTPPPRTDSYRARSPPRRNDFAGDTYRGGRARSRTPPRREEYRQRSPSPARYREREIRAGAGDTYRARPRSPAPRREELPRDDLFRKEPSSDTRDYRDERTYRDDREQRDERDYRDERDRGYVAAPTARSPAPRYRDRSPVPLKRGREPSPVSSRGRRSPPPAKRERLDSPGGRAKYDEYSRSRPQSPPRRQHSPEPRERRASPRGTPRVSSRSPPSRNDRVDPRAVNDWRRPRSPSPQRPSRYEYLLAEENGGRDSGATSRRSTPHVHPSRLQQVDERTGRPAAQDAYDSRDPYRARSPEPSRRQISPPPQELDYEDDRGYAAADDRIPPPREQYRADNAPPSRAPPTGPSGYRAPSSSMAPPTGPAGTTSISAHARTPAVPPSGPRSAGAGRGDFGAPRGRGGYRGDFGGGKGGFGGDFRGGRGGFGGSVPLRGGRGSGPPDAGYGRGALAGPSSSFNRSESFDRESDYAAAPPAGPGGSGAPPLGPRSSSFSQAAPPPRQSNNTTATTYPRTQRFGANGAPIADSRDSRDNTTTPTGPRSARSLAYPPPPVRSVTTDSNRPHPALADLPKLVEGGQKREPLVDTTRLDKLQEEAEKLRKQIEEKETRKRKSLREWDRLQRETDAAALRTALAEESLRAMDGEMEGGGMGAF